MSEVTILQWRTIIFILCCGLWLFPNKGGAVELSDLDFDHPQVATPSSPPQHAQGNLDLPPPPYQADCTPAVDPNTWYCDGNNPAPPPPPLTPDPNIIRQIDGKTIEELEAIFERHVPGLSQIPGFAGGGVDKDGLFLYVTPQHGSFPMILEGVHIHLLPVPLIMPMSAGFTQTQRPLRGALEIGFLADIAKPSTGGTLTGTVLAHGMPWLIFPQHILPSVDCSATPPYPLPIYSGNPLWKMPRYTGTFELVEQPSAGTLASYPNGISYPQVGYVQTWDPSGNHPTQATAGYDVAAAALDNNYIPLDNSVGFQSVAGYTGSALAPEYDGYNIVSGTNLSQVVPVKGVVGAYLYEYVYVFTNNTSSPVVAAQVVQLDFLLPYSLDPCGNPTEWVKHNFKLQTLGRHFLSGDSGSPIVEGAFNGLPGYYAGMFNWGQIDPLNPANSGVYGGGIQYKGIAEALMLEDNGANLASGEYRPAKNSGDNPTSTTSLATTSSTTLDAFLSPNTSWSGTTVHEICAPLYIYNESTANIARGVEVLFLPTGTPAQGLPTFRYINPNGYYNTPYDLPAGATIAYQACLLKLRSF